MITSKDILQFWFGADPHQAMSDPDFGALWWAKNDDTDEQIRAEFGETVESAASGALDDWTLTAEGRLALIILLDQFPRNIYRNSPRAFAYDSIALQLALDGINKQEDQELAPIQRVFAYLPLEHSESIDTQHRCVDLFEALANGAPESMQKALDGYLDYAKKHRTVIEQFGRFPHRNTILNRESTPEELSYLSQPGAGF